MHAKYVYSLIVFSVEKWVLLSHSNRKSHNILAAFKSHTLKTKYLLKWSVWCVSVCWSNTNKLSWLTRNVCNCFFLSLFSKHSTGKPLSQYLAKANCATVKTISFSYSLFLTQSSPINQIDDCGTHESEASHFIRVLTFKETTCVLSPSQPISFQLTVDSAEFCCGYKNWILSHKRRNRKEDVMDMTKSLDEMKREVEEAKAMVRIF